MSGTALAAVSERLNPEKWNYGKLVHNNLPFQRKKLHPSSLILVFATEGGHIYVGHPVIYEDSSLVRHRFHTVPITAW